MLTSTPAHAVVGTDVAPHTHTHTGTRHAAHLRQATQLLNPAQLSLRCLASPSSITADAPPAHSHARTARTAHASRSLEAHAGVT